MRKRAKAVKPAKKRIGRPTKPPKPGERVPLGLRVTPEMKKRLEQAAIKNGRSLSQEVELRLERSLYVSRHLMMAQGDIWSPVLFSTSRGELWIGLGNDPRDAGIDPRDDETAHLEHLVVLRAETEDLQRLKNYFDGAPYPWTRSKAEIEAEIEEAGDWYIQSEIDRRRGK
jgi:hypothetical protein